MIGCIVQVRMSSSRLPGKVLKKLDENKTVLDYVIDQVSYCKLIDKIIIATTNEKEDDKIIEFAKNRKLDYFRGSSKDVLDRYYQCAKKFNLTTIIRITSDNPLNDPIIIDELIQKFLDEDYDYATNELKRTFPQGIFVQIYSNQALENSWRHARLPSEREHVSPYIEKNKNKFNILNLEYHKDLSYLRFTIDSEEDLKFVKEIIKRIKNLPINMEEIIGICENEKKLVQINKNYILDEGYKISIKEDEEFEKK